jgi:uncharacterized surface protein with fasciclin (FAS1) repeats
MHKPIRILLAAFVVLSLAGGALASGEKVVAAKPTMDIVDTAVAAGTFGTLVTAVKAASLVETLKGEGPFTVFAPTDEAFAKLPKGTVEGLLADKAKLTEVLTYHVLSGKVMAADVLKLKDVTTVQGSKAVVDAKAVTIDGVKIVQTDIVCSNGVIHVIDAVMLP